MLKPGGSVFVNLGDKYAGAGGHNNAGISDKSTLSGNGHQGGGPKIKTTRRSAPDRYNQSADGVRRKSLMGLPWRYALGCIDGQADPCTRDHAHHGTSSALLPSERCRGTGWVLRAEIVWSKPNGLPESVTDRVRRSHETWFHLTKSERYFSDMDAVREAYSPAAHNSPPDSPVWGDATYPTWGLNGSQSIPCEKGTRTPPNPLGKLPSSVWTIPTQPLQVPGWLAVDHFAAFPTEWPRRLILGWSPPDGVILDPFGGTGTTAMAARALGRFGVSLDLSADYLRLANWRVFQSGQAAKVAARTDGERQGALL